MRKFAKCYPGELSSADQDFDLVGPRRKTKKRALGIQPRALREWPREDTRDVSGRGSFLRGVHAFRAEKRVFESDGG